MISSLLSLLLLLLLIASPKSTNGLCFRFVCPEEVRLENHGMFNSENRKSISREISLALGFNPTLSSQNVTNSEGFCWNFAGCSNNEESQSRNLRINRNYACSGSGCYSGYPNGGRRLRELWIEKFEVEREMEERKKKRKRRRRKNNTEPIEFPEFPEFSELDSMSYSMSYHLQYRADVMSEFLSALNEAITLAETMIRSSTGLNITIEWVEDCSCSYYDDDFDDDYFF